MLFLTLLVSNQSFSQDWEREEIAFGDIEEKAKELAAAPYEQPDLGAVPEWIKSLSYDQYQNIGFNEEHTLWVNQGSFFRAMFCHPGGLFKEPVGINEFTKSHLQKVRLSQAFFRYGHLVENRGELPADGGFSGFKLLAPINSGRFDEVAVFQGSSYWRALGEGQKYGISARGIAVNTGVDGETEEFPRFREFWLKKPESGEKQTVVYGLLDGSSFTGAYQFVIIPGKEMVMNVRAVIYARSKVTRLGIAPMSSMFWFGENTNREFDDFRPEVHDSDGLAILTGTGERIWRPAANDTGKPEFSFFSMEKCNGFGLLQRDRKFESYEDLEARYDQRPSLWIEPTSDWGKGSVMLMEIPTENELTDNMVAMWVPEKSPEKGERREYSYRQRWTLSGNPAAAAGRVAATRTGLHDWQPEQRMMVVDFTGVQKRAEAPEAIIVAEGEAGEQVKIEGVTILAKPDGTMRLSFQIAPKDEGAKLADIGEVELRVSLKSGEDYLTETWAYRINP
ncbi:MAG: glucan biosynthesis protein [Luteolibacter sp.]